jgi:hypothetical protein
MELLPVFLSVVFPSIVLCASFSDTSSRQKVPFQMLPPLLIPKCKSHRLFVVVHHTVLVESQVFYRVIYCVYLSHVIHLTQRDASSGWQMLPVGVAISKAGLLVLQLGGGGGVDYGYFLTITMFYYDLWFI